MTTGIARLVLLAAFLALGVRAQAPPTIPVLLITGANNHDWEYTSRVYERFLEATGRFDVTITETPKETLADAEMLSAYRLFLLDYNGPRWGDAAEANFLAAVRAGTGVVVCHAANNPFKGWKEYEDLVCLCWRKGTGHGPVHAFDVRLDDRNHPVTWGMPDLKDHPDELYHRLVNPQQARYRQLGSAYSSKEMRGTGQDEPMVIVRHFGRGRIFHTPLGHVWRNQPTTRESVKDPQFQMLVARGAEWAATGEVSLKPTAFGLKPAAEALVGMTYGELEGRRCACAWWTDGLWILFEARSGRWLEIGAGHGRILDEGRRGPQGLALREFSDRDWAILRVADGTPNRAPSRLKSRTAVNDLVEQTRHFVARGRVPVEVKETITQEPGDHPALLRRFEVRGLFHHERLELPLGRGRLRGVTVDGSAHLEEGRIVLLNGTSSLRMEFALRDDVPRPPRIRQAPWISLLDEAGAATHWRGYKKEGMPEKGWSVRDGVLTHRAGQGGGDLITRERFSNFEFACEWRIAKKGNSGIMFLVGESQPAPWMTGPEMQVLDDAAYTGRLNAKQMAGALYDLVPGAPEATLPAGEWNRARIRLQNGHLQQWLNGIKTTDIRIGGRRWNRLVAASKFGKMPEFGKLAEGHIALQDHGDTVSYRRLRIRRL